MPFSSIRSSRTPAAQDEVKVVPIAVPGGAHRLTFITGSVDAKAWMDAMR